MLPEKPSDSSIKPTDFKGLLASQWQPDISLSGDCTGRHFTGQ